MGAKKLEGICLPAFGYCQQLRMVCGLVHISDYLFPSIGCRFIALNNGIDSMSTDGSTDVMCFLNLFNEFYSRDTSKKVRAVKKACAETGKFMGTYPPYGYQRDPEDKHHFIIDEETAPVVRRIFAMRASGMGYYSIAAALNDDGIQSPRETYYQQRGQDNPHRSINMWTNTIVKTILRNEAYIGNLVQGKFGKASYKSRKLVRKSSEEWIRVDGTHEPIVSREIWDTVVSIGEKRVRKSETSDGIKSIFTGLVYCADCGFKMRNKIDRTPMKGGEFKRYSRFTCSSYAKSGKTACTIHSINEDVLRQLVLADIREKAQYAEYDQERLLAQIVRMKNQEQYSRMASYEQELKVTAARVRELEKLMKNLYEDKCTGVVPQTVFQTLIQKYEAERAQKATALLDLERKVREQLESRHDAARWAEIIRRYTEITDLDETILFELVDRIEVGEKEKQGNICVCKVKVYYRYVGNVDDALAKEAVAV